jgi:DNA-binding GntR family transcriptional regulator
MITQGKSAMVFKPTLNITEQIADHLAELVICGELKGGTRIQEIKIANELGVSRGSVREALLILERRYLIDIMPRKGAVVNHLSRQDALELVDMLASIERRRFHHIVSNNKSRENLAAAEVSLVAMEAAARTGQLDDLLRARKDFYDVLLSDATRYMQGVFECLLPSSQRLIRSLMEQAGVDLYDIARYYRALFGALDVADRARLDELLNAFHKRLLTLCGKTFGDFGQRASGQRDAVPMQAGASNLEAR